MHYISLLLMVLLVNLSVVSAQITRTSYRINFEVDKAELDLTDKQVLDQILTDYRTTPYGELQLTAHTDADAADDYNMQLSRKRADAVMAYFTAQGMQPNRISVKWFGERKPEKSNMNDEGKSVNRRVDVLLTKVAFEQVGDLIKLAAPEYKQTFTINPNKDNIIKGRNGTIINIPKGSLMSKKGKPITSESVQIVMEEFLKPSDAAFQQLSTISNGRLLQSGGMFSVKAFAQDEEVVLKKGQKLQVEMPSINMQKGMELFTAVANAEGITEWKPTSQPFNPKGYKAGPVPFTKVDTKYLNSLKIPLAEVDAGNVLLSYDLPSFPIVPKEPVLKYKYTAPNKQTFFAWYERWFVPDFMLNKKLETEAMKRMKIADEAQVRYDKKMDIYRDAYTKYVADSAAYENSTLDTVRSWLRTQREQHQTYIKYMETKKWNAALAKLIEASDNNSLTYTNPKGLFLRWTVYDGRLSDQLQQHKLAIQRIDNLLTKSMANIVETYSKEGMLSLDVSKVGDYYSYTWNNETADNQMTANPKLTQLFNEAQLDILDKRQKAGLVDKDIVGNVYATSLSGFGTFNCDMYDNTPPQQMATITIPYEGDARVSFYVPKTNSYTYANKTKKGYTASLPKGTPVKVIFVTFNKENGPMLSIQKTTFKENTRLTPDPKSVTLVELQKGLTAL